MKAALLWRFIYGTKETDTGSVACGLAAEKCLDLSRAKSLTKEQEHKRGLLFYFQNFDISFLSCPFSFG